MPNTALIFCDGEFPKNEIIKGSCKHAHIIIACDGAGNHLLESGIIPNVIIGDLDSFSFESVPQDYIAEINIIKDEDQETNDLEKALLHALQLGYTIVEVLGGFGKRMDHTLKNLSVLQRFSNQFDFIYFRDDWSFSFFAAKETYIFAPKISPISLVPFNGRVSGITTNQLEFSLANEWLENGKRDGTSNKMSSDSCQISKQTGELLVVLGLGSTHKQISISCTRKGELFMEISLSSDLN